MKIKLIQVSFRALKTDGDQTDESTLTMVSRVSCPRIMNVLHGQEGKMLNRPFLQKNTQSYREQLLAGKSVTHK